MKLVTGPAVKSANRASIRIFGAGAWGTTLAIVAHRAGCSVTLVTRHAEAASHLREKRTHPRSLPGVVLPADIEIATTGEIIGQTDISIIAFPVQQLRQSIIDLAPTIQSGIVVSAAKGIEIGTLHTPVSILRSALPHLKPNLFVALSGPNLAGEIAAGHPATTVVASDSLERAIKVQGALTSETFRVYTSTDVIGLEMGGALKNIVAIGAGIADGLGAGHNAKAAFMTRGIAEISRLGIACGAEPLTFAGLSGIGDLIATCGSMHSRNHTVGRLLAEGKTLEQIIESMFETAEGIDTTRAALQLAIQHEIDAPIIRGMHAVLFEGVSPLSAAAELMAREPTSERH